MNQVLQPIPYDTPGVPGILTPAERWVVFADSYYATVQGRKQLLKDQQNWFVPVDVLEDRLVMADALQKRSELGPLTGFFLDLFGEIHKIKKGPEERVGVRLSIARQEDGMPDLRVTEISKAPDIVVITPDNIRLYEEGSMESHTETFFAFGRKKGTPNPYEGTFPAIEPLIVEGKPRRETA